jgi:hypothetical protein
MPEREVKKIAVEFLRPLNQGLAPIGAAVGFEDYVETVYKTTILPLMAKSTQDRYTSVITRTFREPCHARMVHRVGRLNHDSSRSMREIWAAGR